MASMFSPIGSVGDVKLANGGIFQSYMDKLGSAMGSSGGFGGGYNQLMDTATNYNNMIAKLLGGGGMYESLRNSTGNFDPNAATAQFMSLNPQMQGLANQALSGVEQSTRAQAQSMGDQARREAASQLANSGLLNSGAAVGAMTQATVNPMLQAEAQLANTRASYLGNLQNQIYGGLSGAYQNAGQLGLGAMQLGGQLQGMQGDQYGQAAGLMSQLYGMGSQMSAPEYWQPQYAKGRDFFDYANLLISGIGAVVPG